MKEHKNPKVLSEGLLWMVSAVEDFGISLLKLKVLGSSFSLKIEILLIYFLNIFGVIVIYDLFING